MILSVMWPLSWNARPEDTVFVVIAGYQRMKYAVDTPTPDHPYLRLKPPSQDLGRVHLRRFRLGQQRAGYADKTDNA